MEVGGRRGPVPLRVRVAWAAWSRLGGWRVLRSGSEVAAARAGRASAPCAPGSARMGGRFGAAAARAAARHFFASTSTTTSVMLALSRTNSAPALRSAGIVHVALPASTLTLATSAPPSAAS